MKISPRLYTLLLAGGLSFAGLRLLLNIDQKTSAVKRSPSFGTAAAIGGLLGLFSGMIGAGGGIFLSPILILFCWADPQKTAATSAFFILVNSISGLIGRSLRGNLDLTKGWPWMVLAVFLGGILGARHFSGARLKRILALVLFLAVFKLFRSI